MKMLFKRANTMLNKADDKLPLEKIEPLEIGNKAPLLKGELFTKWKQSRNKVMALRTLSKLRDDVLMFGTSDNLLDVNERGVERVR
jgi:hypothetical protein